MNILVAGGAGYIGSHVCKLLDKKGYNVTVFDNLSRGYRDFARWGEFVQGDIADFSKLDNLMQERNFDAVMHFCAFIEVGESVTDPEKYYSNNLKNTITLLSAMRKNNIDKFIFSSTAAVYGMPESVPIDEECGKAPINPYGRTKWMVERILDDYSEAYGFKSIRFRYFNAAGADTDCEIGEAHNPESHLIPLILDAVIGKRDSIKIFGTDYDTPDGTCIRDYIHVEDLAEAHYAGLLKLLEGGKTDVFNLGCGTGYSVREVIDTVGRVTGRDFKVEETSRRPGDPSRLIASSDRAKISLNWKPKHSLDDMIETAWRWHQKLNNLKLK